MVMKHTRLACLFVALISFAGLASDEIQGSAADVLAAIKGRQVGRVYAFDALVSVRRQPQNRDSSFATRQAVLSSAATSTGRPRHFAPESASDSAAKSAQRPASRRAHSSAA